MLGRFVELGTWYVCVCVKVVRSEMLDWCDDGQRVEYEVYKVYILVCSPVDRSCK